MEEGFCLKDRRRLHDNMGTKIRRNLIFITFVNRLGYFQTGHP